MFDLKKLSILTTYVCSFYKVTLTLKLAAKLFIYFQDYYHINYQLKDKTQIISTGNVETGPKFPVEVRSNQQSYNEFQSFNETDLNTKGKYFK